MYARGIAATGIADVLAASGTGKSQLYHYFADKSDLVLAVIDRQLERVLEAQPELAGEDLQAWAASVWEFHRAEGEPLACPLGVLSGQVETDERWRARQAASFTAWQDRIAALLARGQRAGRVDPTRDADELAVGVLAALQGGLMLARLHRDLHVLELALAAAVDHVRVRA